MRYVMKQKLLAFGDDFSILDETGREAFYFDGKVMTFRKTIVVKGPDRKEIAVIKKCITTFRPTYVVQSNGSEVARIYKKLFSFRKSFVIDVPGPDDITISGSLLEHNYSFYRNGTRIAQVSKKWFKSRDTYGIEIEKQTDVILALCGAVVVDLLCHPLRDSSGRA